MYYKLFAAFGLLLALGTGCVVDIDVDSGDDDNDDDQAICQDMCGNGTCEEIVCLGTDCPCAETADSCADDCEVTVGDLIHVTTPADDQEIGRPVTLTGEARGYWYFEATFPIKVYDSNNNLLGQGYATAQGDWMTEDFVPFTATVNYTPATTSTGYIVLEKDNPSGLPENDNSITVPVTF